MFQPIIKLLKSIQFWTILGTIAAIISALFLFYHPKQSDINVFVGADSRLVGPISYNRAYDLNKSDTIAIFYLMPILDEIDHTCYYIVDLPLNITSADKQPVKNVVVSTNNTVPDFNILNNPMLDNYSGTLDYFFNNGNKYPRLFVNNNSQDLIREYDKSTKYVDFYDDIPSHAHITLPLRLIFYTPTNIRNKIIDSFSFDLVFGEEDYENRHMPINVFGFLCNLRDFNYNHHIDQEEFLKVASQYSTTIYVNAIMEKCNDINEYYWITQKGNHMVSYINSSIGSLHVFNSDNQKSSNNTFSFSTPDFTEWATWVELIGALLLLIDAQFCLIPDLKKYYSFKKSHKQADREFWFKFSGTEINNAFWLYSFWIFSILSYPLSVVLLLDLFSNVDIF